MLWLIRLQQGGINNLFPLSASSRAPLGAALRREKNGLRNKGRIGAPRVIFFSRLRCEKKSARHILRVCSVFRVCLAVQANVARGAFCATARACRKSMFWDKRGVSGRAAPKGAVSPPRMFPKRRFFGHSPLVASPKAASHSPRMRSVRLNFTIVFFALGALSAFAECAPPISSSPQRGRRSIQIAYLIGRQSDLPPSEGGG